MSKRKKIKQKKQDKARLSQILEYLKKKWIETLISIAVVIISVLLTKACDRIMPNQPIVIEKIPDTIQVIHVHNPLLDTLSFIYNESEGPVDNCLRNQIATPPKKNQSQSIKVNKVFPSAVFPKAKGYSIKSAAPFFTLEMSPLGHSYVDFTLNFFDEEILAEIYCLSLKVCKIQNGKRILVLDANYEKKTGNNVIRLKNIFGNDNYEIEVGFFFSKDRNSQYPNFYRETRYVNDRNN